MAFRDIEDRLRILESKNSAQALDLIALQGALSAATARGVPTGVVQEFAGTAAPAGWLLCQGQAVSRTTYAALFAAIGTAHGAGNGSSTFNVPDRRGRVGVGLDTAQTEFNTLGKTGGSKSHALTPAEGPVHSHSPAAIVDATILKWGAGSASGTGNAYLSSTGTGSNVTKTGDAGGGAAHNNLQPYVTENFIIRT
ncbi:microcystin-dependent protein [Microterricola gilva]|uniref:Microcystin-dependent protein n=1 Tax=Microterricola gilva TaxID=393267 RepID=A0A4Q8ARL3_9MICO|nr:tail fiber protein [Microterricola gilva]RZU66745.1 microcystin-dependent protein [Microterricola gilva]